MKPHAAQGFTLIELLVALLILVLIALAGYRGLNVVIQVREQVACETRKWQHLSYFFSQMEQDIAQATHRSVRDANGQTQAEWQGHPVTAGEDDAELIFTRAGIADSHGGAPQRIGYRFNQGKIELLRWSAPDAAPSSHAIHYPVLEGVREFKLRYLDGAGNWQPQWPPVALAKSLPQATEVSLTLSSGEQLTRVFALQ